jgi:hypothetical protein
MDQNETMSGLLEERQNSVERAAALWPNHPSKSGAVSGVRSPQLGGPSFADDIAWAIRSGLTPRVTSASMVWSMSSW